MSDEAIQKPYVDYDYYSKDYRGTEASKTTFEQNLKWATALIDTITFGRIRSLEVIPDCVKDAICCAVEKYSTYQKLRNQELKSESNDGYSVSYADAGKDSRSGESLQFPDRGNGKSALDRYRLWYWGLSQLCGISDRTSVDRCQYPWPYRSCQRQQPVWCCLAQSIGLGAGGLAYLTGNAAFQ